MLNCILQWKSFLKMSLPALLITILSLPAAHADAPVTSYAPVTSTQDLATTKKQMEVNKTEIEKQHQELLNHRYDLSNKPFANVKMSGGKPTQEGGVQTQLNQQEKQDLVAFMEAL